ncbi:MAG: hypothetical protein GWN97_22510 [Thermoplasmata archaeon]|nr:hypothetical protein [Thermoplasmata archaeon]NIT80344.1 hypothetical protein [Thermoplasmata archaeon]NIY06712.1 hypothetical protein [Thermoplasmata archaeon]
MIEQGIFGPSERPGEPITEGLDFGQVGAAEPSMIPDDPDEVLRAIYEAFPHPAIARLIRE